MNKYVCFFNFLQVNLFFLLNIIRVLVTKLRDTHRAESNMYMKAVRATLILVPLLGIQFVICPWRPENRLAGEVYEYIMHILMHYQVPSIQREFCLNTRKQPSSKGKRVEVFCTSGNNLINNKRSEIKVETMQSGQTRDLHVRYVSLIVVFTFS